MSMYVRRVCAHGWRPNVEQRCSLRERAGKKRDEAGSTHLVERSKTRAVAADAPALAEGELEGLAEGERAVLGRVVVVDVDVALAVERKREPAVLGEGVEHLAREKRKQSRRRQRNVSGGETGTRRQSVGRASGRQRERVGSGDGLRRRDGG